MSNFRFIDFGLDVQPFLDELKSNDELWKMVWNMDNVGGLKKPYGFLPLTMGVQVNGENIKNSEKQQNTPAYWKFPVMQEWLKSRNATNHARAAFFRLKPGGIVGSHIDDGTYYLTKDRYHFSLQGEYEYWVNGETHIIKPGTFFWFDNKLPHAARNISDVDRVTFVFDLPHSATNP